MKKIISIIIPILACLLNAPVQAGTCDVWGNQDFTVTFNVVGPASNSYVYLDHSGSHPREVLWYNGYEYGNANYYFDEPNLLAGQPYNIRLEHQVSHNSGTLKYYRKFAGGSEWQLIDVKNDVDLKNGKLTLYDQGSPSQVDCSGSTPDPVEPEVPDDVCQYFPQPIQGMKGYTENTLNVPNKSARALGWSEEYKSYYTVTNKEDLFYYSPNAQQPNKPQYILAGFDKANVDDARDRLYRSPICGSDTGCDVGNIDGYLESRKANEPLGVATNFGDESLHITAENIEQICSNNSLCRANTYSVDGKTGIEIQVISNLDTLDINQYNSPYDQVKVILPNQTNIKKLVMKVGTNDDVRLVIPEDAEVTLGQWSHTGHGKYTFFNQSKINVSGDSVIFNNPIAITTHYYVTIYAPDANIIFKTRNPDFYGFVLANRISFENPITVHGSVTSRHLTMKNGVVIKKPDYSCPVQPPVQQCNLLPMETFSSSNVDNWSVIGYGSSVKPQVINGRFRLNDNSARQATASAYNYLFPSDKNYLEIEFDHFAYGGGYDGADGVALVISDANVPPQTGAFGGPLGYGMKLYKNHSGEVSHDVEGFAGGWLGIGIDEYGNFYREGGESLATHGSPNSVGVRGPGIKDSNGKWVQGYEYIKGVRFNQPLDNRSNTPHRYKVVLNSRYSGVITLSVQRKVGVNGQWSTVISDFDVLTEGNFNYTPENFRISVTASTGALTNTHEMDNFQVCADKFQKITDGIHHFEFDYAGTGSICQASEVTLRACMDESCSKTYPSSILNANPGAVVDPVTVSLLPQSDSLVAWEGGDHVTFSDSVSLKLQAFQSGSAKLGIASSSVPQFGFDGAKCRIAGGPLSEQNCNILFNSAALGVTVPDKVAGKPFFNTDGDALYSNQSSPYLEFCSLPSQQGGNGENRDVQLSIERIEPTSNAVSVPVYVSFKKRDGKFSDEVSVGTTDVDIADVYFNSQGKAYFNLRYPEAGKVALKAKIKDESDSLGQNSFVSFPAYLTLSTDGGQCSSGSCSQGFVAAGEPFNMFVTAHQFGGALAKNYQQEGLSVVHKVTYPTTGALSAGVLGKDVYNHDTPTNAKDSIEQSVSEVGAFEFTVTPPEAYLGSKAFVIEPAKGVIGRFYPKYFKVYPDESVDWDYPNAQSFAYMNQPFGVSKFYVEALNAGKGALTNYTYFDDSLLAKFNLYENGAYTSRFSSIKTYSGTWKESSGKSLADSRSVGIYTGSSSDGLFVAKGNGAHYPDGPFNLFEQGKDTLISITGSSSSMDPVTVIESDSVLAPQPDIRFGRVDLDDVGGNQGTTLRVPLRVEYWNGSRFIANSDDSQTRVLGETEDGSQVHIWPTDNTAKVVSLGAGGLVSSGYSRSVTATEAESYRQQTRVWLDLESGGNSLPWLKYNWDNKNAGEENPSSVVTFGIHRGNDRVIYRGEPGLTGQ
ncbi:MSHA biogenesis protein MshQ [Vibrio parahaemolyticus]|nr:MSHA biogenesis protein MshQ [Vibrio parahaemolyticus]